MAFAISRGSRIHYTSHGEAGPTVVLLQGLGLSSRFWFDVPERLAAEAGTPRRVIAIDNRGTGASGRPGGVWTMATMADDVQAVLDHAGVEQAMVVGISMGGMIAQHFALRHPARVRGLVLFATTPGFLYGTLPAPQALMRLLSLPFRGKRASENLAKLLLPETKWHRAREIFRDWPNAMRDHPPSARTFAAHFFAASMHVTGPRLRAIRCPVLVVAGEHDELVPRGNAEALVRGIPGAELEVVPDTGHAVFADDRDLVRRMVRKLEARVVAAESHKSTAAP